jgi:hypothetical protein
MFNRIVAVVSSMLLVATVWAGSLPVGTIDVSHQASLSGAPAEAGSSVFVGDSLAVAPEGSAALNLRDGSRVVLSANSATKLVKSGSRLAVEVNQGGIILTAGAKSMVEGQIADASFRPASPAASTGWMGFTAPNHIVLYAEKGDWLVSNGPGGHSLILHPGEKIEGTVATSQQGETPEQANKNKKKRKLAVIWIGTALVGVTTGLALSFGQSECTIGNGPGCAVPPVASPVTPQ